MSAVATVAMSEREAMALTERIRIAAVNFADAKGKLLSLVQEAKDGNAHIALGYASWTAYLADVLGEEPMRLARGERQEMVQMLSNEGLSRDAIAAITGVAEKTIQRDMQEETFVPPSKVTGMDGKTYTRPESVEAAQPKRRPVTDQAQDAAWELLRAAEKLQRIFNDDRFPKHRDTISTHVKGNLNNSLNILNNLINNL